MRPIGSAREAPGLADQAAAGIAAVLLAVLRDPQLQVVQPRRPRRDDSSPPSAGAAPAAVTFALADPAHRTVQLHQPQKNSTTHADVVVLPDGRAYWVDDDLSALPPAGRTSYGRCLRAKWCPLACWAGRRKASPSGWSGR